MSNEGRDIYRMALALRTCEIELKEAKDRNFSSPTPVWVDAPRYRGYGVVMRADEPADQLCVFLENGNRWHYPIECCRRVSWKEVDRATRRAYLSRRGIQCAGRVVFTRFPTTTNPVHPVNPVSTVA